jgi:hypothetical protein
LQQFARGLRLNRKRSDGSLQANLNVGVIVERQQRAPLITERLLSSFFTASIWSKSLLNLAISSISNAWSCSSAIAVKRSSN